MPTPFQKAIKQQLEIAVTVDRITCRKDGSVEARRSYFYRMGGSAEKFAAHVAAELAGCGFPVAVRGVDEFKAWPTTSYFCAIITEVKS